MIAVITYDSPHRKTQDVLGRLLVHGIRPTVIALPFKERAVHKPLYQHRPQQCENIGVKDMCVNLGLEFIRAEDPSMYYNDFDRVLIAGAGIIPAHEKVINIHPGYLPYVRGLDAFKWAVYKGLPIGVTAHKITQDVDNGEILIRTQVIPQPTDTFYGLAMRVYETELSMFVPCAQGRFQSPVVKHAADDIYTDAQKVHKRMPHDVEVAMMRVWENRQ